jgi:DNA repair ATPase RecN
MSVVAWFVENDMRSPTKEEYEEEIDRINREETEYRDSQLECWKSQYEEDGRIMAIYLWWKTYPKRQEELEKSLTEWHLYERKFKKDPEDWFGGENPKTEEEAKEAKRLLDYHSQLEDQLKKEEQDYLKMAIDLRERMWS